MTQAEVFEYRHGTTLLEGYVAYPVGTGGRHPAVLVVHEWWGLNAYARRRADMLADLGYTALAVDMYGQGVHAKTADDAQKLYAMVMADRTFTRERITVALETARKQTHVDPKKVACLGYCMGGSVSLELARSGADIRGAVSFHGALNTTLPAAPGAIQCPLLVLHGAADPTIPPAQVTGFKKEMDTAGARLEFHEYEGALHSFTNPDSNRPAEGLQYNAEADRRSWETMMRFLADVFK